MASRYFVLHQNNVCGPFSAEQVKQLAAAGKLNANTLLAKNSTGPWRKAETVPALVALLDATGKRGEPLQSPDDGDAPPEVSGAQGSRSATRTRALLGVLVGVVVAAVSMLLMFSPPRQRRVTAPQSQTNQVADSSSGERDHTAQSPPIAAQEPMPAKPVGSKPSLKDGPVVPGKLKLICKFPEKYHDEKCVFVIDNIWIYGEVERNKRLEPARWVAKLMTGARETYGWDSDGLIITVSDSMAEYIVTKFKETHLYECRAYLTVGKIRQRDELYTHLEILKLELLDQLDRVAETLQ